MARATLEMLLGSPKTAVYYGYLLRAAEAAAPSLRIDIVPGRIENDAVDIERVIAAIADKPNVAMVVLPDSTTSVNSDLIIALAARHEVFEWALLSACDPKGTFEPVGVAWLNQVETFFRKL